jgi:ribosomal protein L3 glutamine methyltransferase
MTNKLKTIRDLVRWSTSEFNRNDVFTGHGTDNTLDESLALVLHSLSLDYSIPDNYLDSHVTKKEKQQILNLIRARIDTRKPLSYLTGHALFAGLDFVVNEHVLVPRSPFAELINHSYFPWVEPEQLSNALDLCTGSGCIGIATAYYLPHLKMTISDISEKALEVSRQNVGLYNLQDRVTVIHSDLFENIPSTKFDLIVSNPPYVSSSEYESLPPEYHQEPRLGLESGTDGMDIVSEILKQAASFLADNGVIIIEVGASAELLMQRYPDIQFNWIEFEMGGDGIFVMTREELEQYQHCL